MENEQLLKKAIEEKNYEELYRVYNLIYPNDIYNREEGLDADLSIMQKATIMSDNGKHEEAILIAETLLKMKIEEYGEKSRAVQTIRQLIGSFLLTQNKLPEALELLEDVLKNQLEILGENKSLLH